MSNEKGNSGVLVVIILVLLGLVVYLGYDKLKFQKTEDEPVQVQEQNQNQNNDVVKEKTSDERYREYLNNLKSDLNKKLTSNEKKISYTIYNTLGSVFAIVKLNQNLDLTVSMRKSDDTYDDIFVDNDVLSIFLINLDNGGPKYLFYIKADGNVYSTPIGGVINKESYKYKNVVNIQQVEDSNSQGFLFIDVDGKTYSDIF